MNYLNPVSRLFSNLRQVVTDFVESDEEEAGAAVSCTSEPPPRLTERLPRQVSTARTTSQTPPCISSEERPSKRPEVDNSHEAAWEKPSISTTPSPVPSSVSHSSYVSSVRDSTGETEDPRDSVNEDNCSEGTLSSHDNFNSAIKFNSPSKEANDLKSNRLQHNRSDQFVEENDNFKNEVVGEAWNSSEAINNRNDDNQSHSSSENHSEYSRSSAGSVVQQGTINDVNKRWNDTSDRLHTRIDQLNNGGDVSSPPAGVGGARDADETGGRGKGKQSSPSLVILHHELDSWLSRVEIEIQGLQAHGNRTMKDCQHKLQILNSEILETQTKIELFKSLSCEAISRTAVDEFSQDKLNLDQIGLRWTTLISRMAEHAKNLSSSCSASQPSGVEVEELADWLDEIDSRVEALEHEVSQRNLNSVSNESRIRLLDKIKESLQSLDSRYEDINLPAALQNSSTASLDIQEVQTRWTRLRERAVEARLLLEGSMDSWQKLLNRLRELNEWLAHKDAALLEVEQPIAGDLLSVEQQLNTHTALLEEMQENRHAVDDALEKSQAYRLDDSDRQSLQESENESDGGESSCCVGDDRARKLTRRIRRNAHHLKRRWEEINIRSREAAKVMLAAHGKFQVFEETLMKTRTQLQTAEQDLSQWSAPSSFIGDGRLQEIKRVEKFHSNCQPLGSLLDNLNFEANQLQDMNVVLSHVLVSRLEDSRRRFNSLRGDLRSRMSHLIETDRQQQGTTSPSPPAATSNKPPASARPPPHPPSSPPAACTANDAGSSPQAAVLRRESGSNHAAAAAATGGSLRLSRESSLPMAGGRNSTGSSTVNSGGAGVRTAPATAAAATGLLQQNSVSTQQQQSSSLLRRTESLNSRASNSLPPLARQNTADASFNGLPSLQDSGEILKDSVRLPWERCTHPSGNQVPYYKNHSTQATQWDHPAMASLMKRLQEFNTIRFSAYRTGMKLRLLQKELCLDLISMGAASSVFRQHQIHTADLADHLLNVPQIVACLSTFYQALLASRPSNSNHTAAPPGNSSTKVGGCSPAPTRHQRSSSLQRSQSGGGEGGAATAAARSPLQQSNLPLCVDLALNWLLNVYDSARNGRIRVLSFKTAIVLLCGSQLDEKYKFLFTSFADAQGHFDQRRLNILLHDILQIPGQLGESAFFGGSNVDPSVKSCFQKGDTELTIVRLAEFLSWVRLEPQSLVWLPVLHRLSSGESALHPSRCDVCRVNPIRGLRYRCLRCFNFDLCQNCFFSGKTAKNHKLTHPMQEYCSHTTSGENLRDLSRIFRNRLKSKGHFKKPTKLGYLPVTSSTEAIISESSSRPPVAESSPAQSNPLNREMHTRLELYANRLAELEQKQLKETVFIPPYTEDEHQLIAHFCRTLRTSSTGPTDKNQVLQSPLQLVESVSPVPPQHQLPPSFSPWRPSTMTTAASLLATAVDSQPTGPVPVLLPPHIDHVIRQLETENRRLQSEYEQLQVRSGAGLMTLPPQHAYSTLQHGAHLHPIIRDEALLRGCPVPVGVVDARQTAPAVDQLVSEARLLRQHKGQLEHRMEILEGHNHQLADQLHRLRGLITSAGHFKVYDQQNSLSDAELYNMQQCTVHRHPHQHQQMQAACQMGALPGSYLVAAGSGDHLMQRRPTEPVNAGGQTASAVLCHMYSMKRPQTASDTDASLSDTDLDDSTRQLADSCPALPYDNAAQLGNDSIGNLFQMAGQVGRAVGQLATIMADDFNTVEGGAPNVAATSAPLCLSETNTAGNHDNFTWKQLSTSPQPQSSTNGKP